MAIRIRSKQPGFRRAGIAHPAEQVWPAGSIPDEVLAILRAEPMLIVEEVPAILEAQPAADAEGQQAEPEPGADAHSSDAGAPASEGATAEKDDAATNPAPETGEAEVAVPAVASSAVPKRGRKA